MIQYLIKLFNEDYWERQKEANKISSNLPVVRSLPIEGLVCSFCNESSPIDKVYFLDGTEREAGKTVICERCENKHKLVF